MADKLEVDLDGLAAFAGRLRSVQGSDDRGRSLADAGFLPAAGIASPAW
jgi:hypothetical protein